LASIHDLIITNVILKVLYYLDSKIEIMLSVAVNEFANVLALVWAFLDDVAIVLEQVINKELVEIWGR
jgi:hypothetical protein